MKKISIYLFVVVSLTMTSLLFISCQSSPKVDKNSREFLEKTVVSFENEKDEIIKNLSGEYLNLHSAAYAEQRIIYHQEQLKKWSKAIEKTEPDYEYADLVLRFKNCFDDTMTAYNAALKKLK